MNAKNSLIYLRMNIKGIILAAVLCSATSAFCQNEGLGSRLFPAQAVSQWNAGLSGGISTNTIDIDVAYASDLRYASSNGFNVGATVAYHPTGWLSFNSGVLMVQKNWSLSRHNAQVTSVKTNATNNYIALPLSMEISMGRTFKVCGFFGGYVGYWLSGHREGKSLSVSYLVSGASDDMNYDEDYQFNTLRDNRLDAGLTYGVALRCDVARLLQISAELRWYYGLTDLQKNYMENLLPRYNTTRTISLGVAYWL